MSSAFARPSVKPCLVGLILTLASSLAPSAHAWAGLYPTALVQTMSLGGGSYSPAIGDLNGDGIGDLAFTGSGGVYVSLGSAGGALGSPSAVASGGYVVISDITGDGRNDLVIADGLSATILPGLAGGGFGPPASYPVGLEPVALAVGDVDGDGILDIASGDTNVQVSVIHGLAGGGFGPATLYPIGLIGTLESVAIGDLNGDGRNDLAVGGGGMDVTVLYGQPGGGLGSMTTYGSGSTSYVVVIVDLNGDGRMDLATINTLGPVVYMGLPGGVLGARTDYEIPGDVNGLAVGDLGGDGRLDLVMGTYLTIPGPGVGSVHVLHGLPGGGFGEPALYNSGEGTALVAIGDLDGDGLEDVAATHPEGTGVSVITHISSPPTQYYLGGASHSAVALGDLNGDGRPDMAVPNGSTVVPNQVSIFSGLAGGGFSASADFGATKTARAIATGDVNGDGRPDLVTANTASPLNNPGTVSVLLALAGGGYGPNTDYAVGANPLDVKLSDFDGDGRLDIVTANTSTNDISVLMGQAGGSFAPETRYATGISPQGIGVGDLDGDGRLDLAVLNTGSRTVAILLGLAGGGFSLLATYPTPTVPGNTVAIADVNGDGKLDVAIASRISTTPGTIGKVSVYLGLGGGALSARTDYSAGVGTTSVAIGDLNGDGILDLAAAGDYLEVLLGLPGGTFGPNTEYSAFRPRRVQIGDLDGDNRPDLAFVTLSLVGVAYNTGPALAVNHAPTITASASLTVAAGTPIRLVATAMDVDPLQNVTITSAVSPPAPWLVAGGGVSAPSPVTASRSGTASGGVYTITWTATDNSTGAATANATTVVTVTSSNQPPVVSIASPASGAVFAVGAPVSFTGSFTDDAGDTHTAVWSFDALSTPGVVNEGTGTVTASYSFTAAGVYNVSLTVTDNYGASGTATTVGEFSAMVVIYDPDAGFVTGGGWIDSPAGAYPQDGSLVGKANFGFVSKYKKGATVPTGETEFTFSVASLNFHSTLYEWLVVSGSKAQYKGSGTINGAGDYRFMLTATDGQINGGGGIDKLRMKIWDNATSAIVYDNQIGASDAANPVTPLGGGSIVIRASGAKAGDSPAPQAVSVARFALLPNAPNPFNPETSIPYEIAATSQVRLRIFDTSGRLITTLVDDVRTPGHYAVIWNGRTRLGTPAASGQYFVLMEANGVRDKRSIVLLK